MASRTRLAIICLLSALVLSLLVMNPPADGQATYSNEIYAGHYTEKGGAEIYKAICQGCHMPDGKGAKGAGAYPALANNPRLEFAAYPISVVANGQKAMPWFAGPLTDDQIADVVAYVRTHFGNHFDEPVTAHDVAAIRRPHRGDEE